jgi:hypothetical protein
VLNHQDRANLANTAAGDQWKNAAVSACMEPLHITACPACGAASVHAEWNLADLATHEADVDLQCASCSATVRVRIVLPSQVPAFYPFSRMSPISDSIAQELANLLQHAREGKQVLPAVTWMLDPLWMVAGWSATTFRWHPSSEAPPVMGLVFEEAEASNQLFRNWTSRCGNVDELEEIRIAIVEGDVPGQDPGYSVHICSDPETSLIRATAEGIVIKNVPHELLGQLRRMHPLPDTPPLLARFKEEFKKHREFLLAPVTRRGDGQRFVDVECGITTVPLRALSQNCPFLGFREWTIKG